MGLDVGKKVDDYMRRKMAGLHMLLDSFAGNMEQYSKENAPWEDQTGHARQALHGGVDIENDGLHLYLEHGKDYGPLLERGTGIYGPYKKPIERPGGKPLVIPGIPNPKDPSKPLIVRRIKGMKPQPILKPTVKAYLERIKKAVQEYWEG